MSGMDNGDTKLKRGYVMLSRMMPESQLWMLGPDVNRVALDLLLEARWKEGSKKYPGFEVKRGEVLTSLRDIAERTAWFKQGRTMKYDAKKVARYLEKLIEIGFCKKVVLKKSGQPHTYGTHIKICNYAVYQDAKRYKSDESHSSAQNRAEVPQNRTEVPLTERRVNKGEKGEKGGEVPRAREGILGWADMIRGARPEFERLDEMTVANMLKTAVQNGKDVETNVQDFVIDAANMAKAPEKPTAMLRRYLDFEKHDGGSGQKESRTDRDSEYDVFMMGIPKVR